MAAPPIAHNQRYKSGTAVLDPPTYKLPATLNDSMEEPLSLNDWPEPVTLHEPPPLPPLETLGLAMAATRLAGLEGRLPPSPPAAAPLSLAAVFDASARQKEAETPPARSQRAAAEEAMRERLLRIVARQRALDHVAAMESDLRTAERFSVAKGELRDKVLRLLEATKAREAQKLLLVASCLACAPDPLGTSGVQAAAKVLCTETPRPGRLARKEQAELCRALAVQLQEDQRRELHELGREVESLKREGASKDEIISALRGEAGEFRKRGDARDWLVSAMQGDIDRLRRSEAESRQAATEAAGSLDAATRRIGELRETEAALRRALAGRDEQIGRVIEERREARRGADADDEKLERAEAELRAIALENQNLRRELEEARARLAGAPPTVRKGSGTTSLPMDAYSAAIASAFGLHFSPESRKFRISEPLALARSASAPLQALPPPPPPPTPPAPVRRPASDLRSPPPPLPLPPPRIERKAGPLSPPWASRVLAHAHATAPPSAS